MKTVHLGRCDYAPVFEEMKRFNDERTADTEDKLWVVEHNPVFTQGLAHLLDFESAQVVCEFLHDEAVRINRAEWSEEETASWADGICSSIY